MQLEKNKQTRTVIKWLLRIEDRFRGVPFPEMIRVKQINVYACGPAVLQALFSFLGVKITQTAVIRTLRAWNKIKLYGMTVPELAKAAGTLGKKKYAFWKKSYSKIFDLDTIVNKYKYPVGIEWQGIFYEDEDGDNGHYGVVTKVDKKAGTLRICDPYFNHWFMYGTDRKLKITDFKNRWWDTNEIKVAGRSKVRSVTSVRTMFITIPAGDSWPKKLGMVKAN